MEVYLRRYVLRFALGWPLGPSAPKSARVYWPPCSDPSGLHSNGGGNVAIYLKEWSFATYYAGMFDVAHRITVAVGSNLEIIWSVVRCVTPQQKNWLMLLKVAPKISLGC